MASYTYLPKSLYREIPMDQPVVGIELVQQDGVVVFTEEDTWRFDGEFSPRDLVYATRPAPNEILISHLALVHLPQFSGQLYGVAQGENPQSLVLHPVDLTEVWKEVNFDDLWSDQLDAYPEFAKHLVEKYCNPKHAAVVNLDDPETRQAQGKARKVIQKFFATQKKAE